MWTRDNVNTINGLYQDQIGKFYYYYDGYLFRYVGSSVGRMRAKVRRDLWQHGKLADFRDPVWGGRVGVSIPWIKFDSFGELMPQERYIQFKAELLSFDKENSPVLEALTIVTPQDITVPASGTSNAYVKIGVSSDETYQAWYSGRYLQGVGLLPPDDFGNNFSIFYSLSDDGKNWDFATTVSGVWDPNPGGGPAGNETVSSPWVIKESINSYKFWFVRNFSDQDNDGAEIYYAESSDPEDFSGEVRVIEKGLISASTRGAFHPSVLKEGPTSYVVWYTGRDSSDTKRIIRAISSDGISWSGHAISLGLANDLVNGYDDLGVYRPIVIKEDSTYRLWYTGLGSDNKERILYSESNDGISWELPRLNVDIGSEGFMDTQGATHAFVAVDEDLYVLYYIGLDGVDRFLIRAESPDGLEWFDHRLAVPPGGLVEFLDANGVEDFFTLVNRDPIIPKSYITSGKLKLYNGGSAI